jgi:hypothetical protein
MPADEVEERRHPEEHQREHDEEEQQDIPDPL